MTDADASATITQIDGIGAFDHASLAAMLQAVAELPTAHRLVPFLRLACGQPGTYLWYGADGVCREITQGEGGEQGSHAGVVRFSAGGGAPCSSGTL